MKNRTYRYFKGRPLYPFGYGLSFTRFRYSKPITSTTPLVPGKPVIVSTKVTNTGDMDGDEVVQLYITRNKAEGPIRALKGFHRIHLARGESRKVQFLLDSDAMKSVLPDGKRRVLSGKLFIWIGGGQPSMEERRRSAGGLSEISVN
jgi:beta-glucosidase